MLGFDYAVAEVESITLPPGTQAEKLADGHYRFVTPDNKRIEVEGFDKTTTRFDSLSIVERKIDKSHVTSGGNGKIIEYQTRDNKKDGPIFHFPITLTYQTSRPAKPKLTPELSKELKAADKLAIERRGIFSEITLKQERYLVYQELGLNHRLVCKLPCPISRDVIHAKYHGTTHAIQAIVSFTKVDVFNRLIPVTVHLTADAICPATRPPELLGGSSGPASAANGGGSTICIWWYEKGKANMANTDGLRNNSAFIHEYVELLFTLRMLEKPHYFIYPIQWYLVLGGDYKDACAQVYNHSDQSYMIFYNLCTYYGFNFDRLDDLMRQIAWMHANGEGHNTTSNDFPTLESCQVKYLIDEMVGKNTCPAFRNYDHGNQLTNLDECCPP